MSGRPDSNRHAPASDAGEIKPFLYFPIFFGSNTGVEPVSREPQSLMLAITPKAPYYGGHDPNRTGAFRASI